jgi:hypothetical protein
MVDRKVIVCFAVLILSSAAEIRADPITPTVDQSNVFCGDPSCDSEFAGFGPHNQFGQTFTLGIAGLLTRIDVLVASDPVGVPLIVELVRTAAGVPLRGDAARLGRVQIPNPGYLRGFLTVDFTQSRIHTSPDDVLAIVLTAPGDPRTDPFVLYGWDVFFNFDSYPRGTAFSRGLTDDSEWGAWPSDDFVFRTWVQESADPVPEPATVLLISTGLLGLARCGLRKTR